jgi:PAS domain S-box-containing protein
MTETVQILIVDDLPANLLSLRAVLESPTVRVVEARSGIEALKLLLEQDFAVVLLDVHMPGMDGFEVASLLKRRPRSRHTPIIFITALDRDETKVARGYEVGAIDFLHKPVDPTRVRAKVAGLVNLYQRNQAIKREAEVLRENDLRALDDRLAAMDAVRERRYRNLAEAIPPMVWTSHADGSIDYCNQRWFDFTGVDFDLARGWGWLAVLHPDDAAAVTQGWKDAIRNDTTYEVECRLRNATTGTYRWHLARALPERDEKGHTTAWIGTFTDIQDLKSAQAEAEAAHHRIAFLSRASETLATSLNYEVTLHKVAVLAVPRLADWCVVDVVDAEGVAQQMAAAHVDPKKAELAAQLQHRHRPRPDHPNGLGWVLRTGKSEIYPDVDDDHWVSRELGAEHPEILRALGARSYMLVPLNARGQTLGAITFVLSDDRRRYGSEDLSLAEELGQRAALAVDNARLYGNEQLAVRAREEFLTVAAHELRTPLTSLTLRLQTLQRRLQQTEVGRELAALADKALSQSSRMGTLIDDLLDLPRLVSGRVTLERSKVDLGALVQMVADGLRPELERSGSTLEVNVAQPVVGELDPRRVEQIVVNLLSNAAKFGAGKPVTITVSSRPEGIAVIQVHDRGIGISPPDLERIFGPFERAVTQRQFAGVGLGLHIARQLTDAHGGRIRVTSAPGQGTTFTVELPTSEPLTPILVPAPA